MATEIGPALGLTADSKSLVVATEDLRDIAKAAVAAEKAADSFSGSGRRMSSAMASALGVLRSMDASLVKLTQSQRASNQEEQEAARRAASLASQYQALRASMDPIYAASKKYEASLDTLNAAQASGVISSQEYQRSLAMLDAQYAALSTSNAKLAGSSMHTANVFAQFNDIGMMAFAGQSPMMLAIQQGTQLNQVWGQLGGSTKAIGGAIKGAFMSMLSPINLVTIGVIAGGAALVQWGMSALGAEKEAVSLSDTMGGLASSSHAYADAMASVRRTTADVIDEFGSFYTEGQNLLEVVSKLEKAQYERDFAKTKKTLEETYGPIARLSLSYETLSAQIAANKAIIDDANSSWWASNRANSENYTLINEMTAVLGGLSKQYGITAGQAKAVADALNRVKNATTDIERATALTALSEALTVASQAGGKLTDEMLETARSAAEAARGIIKVSDGVSIATAKTNAWASSMNGVRSAVAGILSGLNAISGQSISMAAGAAELSALKAGKSAAEARHAGEMKRIQLEGSARTAALTKEFGLRGMINGVIQQGADIAEANQQRLLAIEREAAAKRERDANKSSGGGAELKAAQKGFQSIRELLEEESLFQFAEHEKRQSQLDAALAKQLLTRQTYDEMTAQLRTLYFGSEWEQQTLRYQMDQEALQLALDQNLITYEEYYRKRKELQWANLLSEDNRSDLAQDLSNTSSYFGQLYSLTGSSLDGLLKLQKGFSAASALISAWEGYAKALADGGLTPWMRLMWAGKILSAGLGAVSAIKGASKGGGSSGGRASSSVGTTATAQSDAPLRVSVDAFDTNQLYTGAAVQQLFTRIQEEAGNRGIIWVPTN